MSERSVFCDDSMKNNAVPGLSGLSAASGLLVTERQEVEDQ